MAHQLEMSNAEVARAFETVADLMEIRGEDPFRINSYRRVARTLRDLTEDISQIAARGELEKLPGVGKGSAERIRTLLETGRLPVLDELLAEIPAGLLELLEIPGMGPKKAALLWKQRGITSLAELEQAIEKGRLKGLRGFGDKSIAQIRDGIAFIKQSAGRTRLGEAWPLAETLKLAVAEMPGVRRVEHAGSLRRGKETVGDLDLLCIADDGEDVIRRFTQLEPVVRVLAAGKTKGSVLAALPGGRQIQVDLRVVPDESFGAAWQYFTGSKEHNVRLREMAAKRGWTLNEYALSDAKTQRVIASKSEEEIYKALGLPWIPPELREDRGEFELKRTPRDLVRLEDIRGELHMHTTASDGHDTIEDMIVAAKTRGYEYVCITDHSQSSTVAGGLKPDRLREHIRQVRAIGRKMRGITVWVGAEVDILSDGRLDYDDELLAELDFVVASVHFGMGKDIEANTRRTLAAIRNPYVNLIAHPTGRLINRREAMPLDIEAVCREAARTGTALEINAHSYRLDLKDTHAKLARDLGAVICVNCDAHSITDFDQMIFGILTARRGWLRKKDVLNTRSAKDVRAFVQAKRRRKP